jgi:hypothetical protein
VLIVVTRGTISVPTEHSCPDQTIVSPFSGASRLVVTGLLRVPTRLPNRAFLVVREVIHCHFHDRAATYFTAANSLKLMPLPVANTAMGAVCLTNCEATYVTVPISVIIVPPRPFTASGVVIWLNAYLLSAVNGKASNFYQPLHVSTQNGLYHDLSIWLNLV